MALSAIASIVSVWCLVYSWFRFRDLRRDTYRMELRKIRDGLFMYMVERDLDFSRPAYRDARQALNGMLQLSNSMSMPLLLLILAAGVDTDHHEPQLVDDDEELTQQIDFAIDRAIRHTLRFVGTSNTGLVLRGIAKVASLWESAKNRINVLTAAKDGAILDTAFLVGGNSCVAAQPGT